MNRSQQDHKGFRDRRRRLLAARLLLGLFGLRKFALPLVILLLVLIVPHVASAHEVYVLTPAQIHEAVTTASADPFDAMGEHAEQFLLWGGITAVALLVAVSLSISRLMRRTLDPWLVRLKKHAPLVARVTFGASLFASGWYGAIFGPELPLAMTTPPNVAHIVAVALMIVGVLIVVGFRTRWMSFLVLALFVYAAANYGWYMLTYANYLGEAILFIILGGGWFGRAFERYSFFILRILFGFALFFASFYAKFWHSNLALMTVNDYHLTDYFHFTPLFLVLGAFIIEALLGLCFMTGFEIRLASIFFATFIGMSLMFFGEAVWPHLILFGVSATLFMHGYDKYTLEEALFSRRMKGKATEPVL